MEERHAGNLVEGRVRRVDEMRPREISDWEGGVPALGRHRSDEAVTPSGVGLDEAWIFGIVFEDLADFANGAVEAVVSVEEDVGTPNSVDQLFAAYEAAALIYQEDQDVHRDALELEHTTGSAQLVGTYVELYIFPDLDDFPGTDWLSRHAAPKWQRSYTKYRRQGTRSLAAPSDMKR